MGFWENHIQVTRFWGKKGFWEKEIWGKRDFRTTGFVWDKGISGQQDFKKQDLG